MRRDPRRYGPPGAALKANIISLWRKHFVIEENLLEIEDPTIMPHEVLKTSGETRGDGAYGGGGSGEW